MVRRCRAFRRRAQARRRSRQDEDRRRSGRLGPALSRDAARPGGIRCTHEADAGRGLCAETSGTRQTVAEGRRGIVHAVRRTAAPHRGRTGGREAPAGHTCRRSRVRHGVRQSARETEQGCARQGHERQPERAGGARTGRVTGAARRAGRQAVQHQDLSAGPDERDGRRMDPPLRQGEARRLVPGARAREGVRGPHRRAARPRRDTPGHDGRQRDDEGARHPVAARARCVEHAVARPAVAARPRGEPGVAPCEARDHLSVDRTRRGPARVAGLCPREGRAPGSPRADGARLHVARRPRRNARAREALWRGDAGRIGRG